MAGLLGQNTSGGLLTGLLANRGATPDALRRKAEEDRRRAMMMQAQAQAPAPAPARMGMGESLLGFLAGGTEGVHQTRERRRAEALRPQQEAQMAQLRGIAESMGPAAIAAFATNPEEFGKALASRLEGRTLDQGDIYMEGRETVFGAPFDATPGSSVFNPLNPTAPLAVAAQENKVAGGALVAPDGRVLYRGPQVEGVAATADAFYTPEIAQGQGGGAPAIVRQSRPDTVTVAPGGEIVQFNPDGSLAGRYASTQQRPLTATDRNAIREDQDAAEALSVINQQLTGFLTQVQSGDLNLGPMTNMISGARNFAGRSDANSRNFASFRAGLEKLRNDSLRLNNGVQTEGDSQRAWNELLANINDEGVVKQRLAEIMQINERAAAYRRARIEDRQGGSAQQPPAASGGVSREAAIAELRRRGRL